MPLGSKMAPPRGSLAPIDLHTMYNGKNIKKNLLLRNHKTQSFHILCVAMYSGSLYKSCQPCPWGPYGPSPGGGGVMGKTKKSSSPKPQGPELSYFVCSNIYIVPVYKSFQLCPWGPYGPRPGGVMGKTLKNLLLRNHKAQSFHILFLGMYSGPLYKSCQPCPWGPYGPCPGGVMGKT